MGGGQETAMATLRILDSVSHPGDPARPNEDAAGGNKFGAFVIDGATGLGGRPLLAGHSPGGTSDAAWLARFAKDCFEEKLVAANSVPEVVRALNGCVARLVAEASAGEAVEPWALPTASFQLVRAEADAIVTYGLGDCRLFVLGADGRVIDASAIAGSAVNEQEGARRAVEHAGGLAAWRSLSEQPEVRAELRRMRARHNQPGGAVWTLGAAPDAGDHVVARRMAARFPARGLLCTDGFAALADNYRRYDGAGLVGAAAEHGLAPLLAELRAIECDEDPDGRKFPRFKVSDDATALLFEVVA